MSEANSISLCMIVRDEEDVLGRCLESVYDLVDEIVIVDTGSQDGTKEIAAAYTERIFDFTWIDAAPIVCGWMRMMFCWRPTGRSLRI